MPKPQSLIDWLPAPLPFLPVPRFALNPWLKMDPAERQRLTQQYGAWAVAHSEALVPERLGLPALEQVATARLSGILSRLGVSTAAPETPLRRPRA